MKRRKEKEMSLVSLSLSLVCFLPLINSSVLNSCPIKIHHRKKKDSMIGDIHLCEIWANLNLSKEFFLSKMNYVACRLTYQKNKMACACPSSRKKTSTLGDDTILFIWLFSIYLNGKIVAHAFIMNKEKINANFAKANCSRK